MSQIMIYDKCTTDFTQKFTYNGRVLNDTLSCFVLEDLNGLFELELKHPLDPRLKWKELIEGNIIKAPTPRGEQLFRIYHKQKTMSGIFVNARHIFYDLVGNFLEDVRPTNLTGAGALDWILTHTQYPHPFRGLSDITVLSSANYVRKNPVKAIMGDDENSFLNRWGGELLRDNFDIKIMQAIGEDRGVTIRYRKNLLGLDCDVNLDGVVTRVMPTGLTADDQILILPEKYVDSPLIYNYPTPKIQEYHFQDIKVSDELTIDQAYELLRQRANELFSKYKVDIPESNTNVNFIELTKTKEYKNYKVLQTIYLGDIVTIHHEELDINLKGKAIKYKYNCLLERYESIELGDFKGNMLDSFNEADKLLKAISDEVKTNKSDLQKAIDNATILLTTALGGYVLKRDGEILIMDTEDPMTAVNIWRWNLNGLGYSKTGINGPYPTAITMDGAIVADFITTGVLDAALIKTGFLKSKNNLSWINMEDGTFNFAEKVKFDGTNFDINADAVRLALGQIGGINLIKDSSFEFGTITMTPINGATLTRENIVLSQGAYRYKIVFSSAQITTGIGTSVSGLVVGKKYTFSADVYQWSTRNIMLGIYNSAWGTVATKVIKPVASTIERHSITFTATETTQKLAIVNTAATADTVFTDAWKLEEGENATTWGPHPEEFKTTSISIRPGLMTVENGALVIKDSAGQAIISSTGVNADTVTTGELNADRMIYSGSPVTKFLVNSPYDGTSISQIYQDNIKANVTTTTNLVYVEKIFPAKVIPFIWKTGAYLPAILCSTSYYNTIAALYQIYYQDGTSGAYSWISPGTEGLDGYLCGVRVCVVPKLAGNFDVNGVVRVSFAVEGLGR